MKSTGKIERELTADMFVSLDGFAAGADGTQNCFRPYFGPELGAYVQRVLDEPHLLLIGRVTYQILSRYWRSATGAAANKMNSLPKLVFSSTLKEPLDWNNSHLAQKDLANEILALKHEPGDPLRSIGSIELVKQMKSLGLVDRFRLVVFPLVLGSTGREPVFDGYEQANLQLIGTKVVDASVVVLEYRPATIAKG